ncbi:MAG: hypothetical protein AB7O66_25945 [Limisphaerales bacterium]
MLKQERFTAYQEVTTLTAAQKQARLHGKLWSPDGNVTLLSVALTSDRALEHPDQLEPLRSG